MLFLNTPIERLQTIVFLGGNMARAKSTRLTLTILCLTMFVLPTVLATVPVESSQDSAKKVGGLKQPSTETETELET